MKKAQVKVTTIVIIAVLVVIAIVGIIIAINLSNRPTTTGNVVKQPYCGDGICNNGESCSTCPSDCGSCPIQQPSTPQPYCGDGICNNRESCSTCPSDCESCKKSFGETCSLDSDCLSSYCIHSICRNSVAYCGDGFCDSRESCSTCPQDCGSCSVQTQPSLVLKCTEDSTSNKCVNSVATLEDSSYKQVNGNYIVDAKFISKTACPITFYIQGGTQTGGPSQFERFGENTIEIQTSDLSSLEIFPHDAVNNINIEGYECEGYASSTLFKFVSNN